MYTTAFLILFLDLIYWAGITAQFYWSDSLNTLGCASSEVMKASQAQHARHTLALASVAPTKVSYLRKSVESFRSPLNLGSSICHRQTRRPRPFRHVTHVNYIISNYSQNQLLRQLLSHPNSIFKPTFRKAWWAIISITKAALQCISQPILIGLSVIHVAETLKMQTLLPLVFHFDCGIRIWDLCVLWSLAQLPVPCGMFCLVLVGLCVCGIYLAICRLCSPGAELACSQLNEYQYKVPYYIHCALITFIESATTVSKAIRNHQLNYIFGIKPQNKRNQWK